jgi:multimeric flavodoxin WrbA
MHFVSFVASERKNGNCDLLGRLAVKYARKNGAHRSEVIYLKDFNIEQCQGCLNCVFKNQKCKINDDLYRLLDRIDKADKLLLIAPVYVLSIPGKLKILLDRFLSAYNHLKDSYGKPAMSIGVAALPDWHQFQLPIMNLVLLALGRNVVDSMIFYGAGPGETLLGDNIYKLEESVKRLIDYREKPFQSQVSKHCPIDFSTLFERTDENMYRCPICLTPAKATRDGYYFDKKDLNNHRWTKEKIQNHFINWIMKTKPRFKSKLREILKKRKMLDL